jgi:Transposase/Transposase IS116/IS110/IS902 family
VSDREEIVRVLFVGDDWAEDHHDVEVLDAAGARLGRARLPEGVEGIARFHALVGRFADPDDPAGAGQVLVGIETDRGPWVATLVAAGYRVFAVNPAQAARFRERHAVSGAKSDAGDAHVLADMVRTDAHQLREVAGDSALAEGIKLLARTHQTLVWERTRHLLRLRADLIEYFPGVLGALHAGGLDLGDRDALELLSTAPDPQTAAGLSVAQITDLLARARRRGDLPARAAAITAALGAPQLTQPPVLAGAYAAVTRSLVAVVAALTEQVSALQGQVETHFGRHPDAQIYRSQPGLGQVLGARALGEFGDDPHRYATAKARKNYAGTSPITRASGRKTVVLARHVRNRRLADALHGQAFSALSVSPGARAYYQAQRARGVGHHAALRQLGNRLVGILHGCLKTRTCYDETTAWAHHKDQQKVAA